MTDLRSLADIPRATPGLLGRLFYSLRLRMVILVSVAVILPSVLVGVSANIYLTGLVEEKAAKDLREKAETLRASLEGHISPARDSLAGIRATLILRESADHIARGASDPLQRKSLRDLDQFFSYLLEDKSALGAVALLDLSGRILYQRPPRAFDTEAIPLPRDLAAGGVSRVIPFPDAAGTPGILALQGLEPTESGARLLVAGSMRLTDLEKILADNAAREGTLAYLMEDKGRILMGPLPPGSSLPSDTGEELTADPGSEIEITGAQGKPVLAIAFTLPVEGWNLVLESGQGQTQLVVKEFVRRTLTMVLALAAVLLLLGLLLARTIVLPLEALMKAAKEIKGGQGLGRKVERRGGGELGELVDAFNIMSQSLSQVMEELRSNSEEFKRLSNTDPLTGRHNRRYIMDTLQRDIRRAKRFGQPLSLIMIDIDHFKRYNDKWGHMAGDEALRGIAGALAASVRDSDVLARYGGEEFLVSLPQTDKPGALFAAEKLRAAVEELVFQPRNGKASLTISLGVATYEEDGKSIDEVIEAADQALYRAKEGGRNRVVSFSGPNPPPPTPSPRSRP